MKNLRKDNKGFTLVELIVVIAILAVLMAVLVPQYIQYVEKSRIGTDESYIGEVAHNMEIASASNEKINGATITVTLAAGTGEWSVTAAGEAASDAEAAMTEELESVLGTTNETGKNGVKAPFKSQYYTAKAGAVVHTLVLADGKVTIHGVTKGTIGNYATAS